jgi:hypothetical protein
LLKAFELDTTTLPEGSDQNIVFDKDDKFYRFIDLYSDLQFRVPLLKYLDNTFIEEDKFNEMIKIKELCEKYESTLLRMDVEGYEYEIFRYGIPKDVKKICLEFHTDLMGEEKTLELLELFKREDFNIDFMIEDLPLRLYPYYKFLKFTGLIKLITYIKKDVNYNKARDLVFEGRGIKYFLLSR